MPELWAGAVIIDRIGGPVVLLNLNNRPNPPNTPLDLTISRTLNSALPWLTAA